MQSLRGSGENSTICQNRIIKFSVVDNGVTISNGQVTTTSLKIAEVFWEETQRRVKI